MTTTLADAMNVPTYRNTNFMTWWKMLNDELAKHEQTQETYGPAKDAYMFGHTPGTAAADVMVIRSYEQG